MSVAPKAKRPNPLRKAFWGNSWILGFCLVFSFFAAILQLTVPVFILLLYDRVLPSRSIETMVTMVLMAVLTLLVMAALDYARRRLLARFGARLQRNVEEDAVSLSVDRAEGMSGPNVRRLDELRGFFHSFPAVALIDTLWMPLFLGAVFLLHPYFGWAACVGVVIMTVVYFAGGALSSWRKTQAKVARDRSSALSAQIRSSRKTVASLHVSTPFLARWRAVRADSRVLSVLSKDRETGVRSVLKALRTIFTIIVLFLGGLLVLRAEITTGALVASVVMVGRVFTTFSDTITASSQFVQFWSNWKGLSAAFDKAPVAAEPSPVGADGPRQLEMKMVSLASAHRKQTVLREVNLSLASGEVVEITGPSGSGKTLLAEALLNVGSIQSGKIVLNDARLETVDPDGLAQIFGYVPEVVKFLPGTIAENIAAFADDAEMAQIVKAAKDAGIHDQIVSLPRGYETKLDAEGSVLSHGQRQQVGLARALYGPVGILVLDCPGDAIDDAVPGGLSGLVQSMSGAGGIVVVLGRRRRLAGLGVRHLAIVDRRLQETDETSAQSTVSVPRPRVMGPVALEKLA